MYSYFFYIDNKSFHALGNSSDNFTPRNRWITTERKLKLQQKSFWGKNDLFVDCDMGSFVLQGRFCRQDRATSHLNDKQCIWSESITTTNAQDVKSKISNLIFHIVMLDAEEEYCKALTFIVIIGRKKCSKITFVSRYMSRRLLKIGKNVTVFKKFSLFL